MGVDVVLVLWNHAVRRLRLTVRDPEGSLWTFCADQPVAPMAPADA